MTNKEIPISEPEKTRSGDHDAADTEGRLGGSAVETIATLEARVNELEQENQQLKDKTLRAIADLENIRRRSQQERLQTIEFANERLLKELLPIVDDFQRTVEAARQTKDVESMFKGITLVHDKLFKILDSQGVKHIEVIGKPFDVHFHEALMRQPSEAPEDSIIAELEPGYMYNDKVLRHSKVIISAGS